MNAGLRQIVVAGVWAWAVLAAAGPAAGQYVETVGGCVQCHRTAPPGNDFCAVAAGEIWLSHDMHRWAFHLLHETDQTNPAKGREKRELVTRILGFELREAFADDQYSRLRSDTDAQTARKVATVKSCLRCHATWPTEADKTDPHAPPVPLELGVSCQACHGPGERWLTPHLSPAWRLVTPAGKAALGFFDCRSTIAKARLCTSCHIGNLAEGKFVKHAWYAAGHPPLPSFELSAFDEAMPRHWTPLRDKGTFGLRDAPREATAALVGQVESLKRLGVPSEEIKASYRAANFPAAAEMGLDPLADLPHLRSAVLGGVTALNVTAKLAGEYASQAAAGQQPWPELALYDCTACHHELRTKLGARSRGRLRHPPGRPPPPAWPVALADLAAFQAAGYAPEKAAAQWSLALRPLIDFERATTIRPFGDAGAMHSAAETLSLALEELAAAAAAQRFDAPAASGALGVLTAANRFETADFATARQLAWAIQNIAADRGDEAAHRLFERRADDPLALTLPRGPASSDASRGVMPFLNEWLSAAARFDPDWFRAQLQSARGTLSIDAAR